MNTDKPLSFVAQRIILAKLNHCYDSVRISTGEIGAFLGYGRAVIFPALKELEAHKFIERIHGSGENNHRVYVRWLIEQRPLWEAAKPLLRNPVVRTYNIATPEDMDAFIPSTESLLPFHNPRYELHSVPTLAYRGASMSRSQNETLITRMPPTKAAYRCEFWRYPPLLPGKTEIDALSLYLVCDTPRDPSLVLYRWILEEQFDWDGKRRYHKLKALRMPKSAHPGLR